MSVTWWSVSWWWVPACLLLGIIYAWVLYRQPFPLSKHFCYILFVIRSAVISITAFLLFSPLIPSVKYQAQKPLILIAQDNSQSIKLFSALPASAAKGKNTNRYIFNSKSWGEAFKKELGEGYEVHEFNFDKELHDSLSNTYTGRQTDISNALHQLNERFVNRNIGSIVLATDGLYNLGADPGYEARSIKTSIYTIALGDTIPRRDLLISNIIYNKTAFLGNDFEIELLAEAYQSNGETMRLSVKEDGREVLTKNISITSPAFKKVVPLKLNADKKGVRKFTVTLATLKNELSVQNNTETFYIEVLDARQKVLLLYDSPHPDIGVIRQSINPNKNFVVTTALVDELSAIKLSEYSLAILYQFQAGSYRKVQSLLSGKIPLWYMAGTQADVPAFNTMQKTLRISAGRQEVQETFAQPVNNFSLFVLSDSAQIKISRLPPLLAPFGKYEVSPAANVLFRQRIGNVVTSYPLLAFNDAGGRRIAVFTGEGLWRWQLAEYRDHGNHHAMEELFSGAVQYLTADVNRERFRVYPSKNIFDEGEDVLLNAELYNDALELVNTPDISIALKNQQGINYSFIFTRTGQGYQLNAGALPVGRYTYMATVKNGKQQFKANGMVTVNQLNLEARQSTANHKLLKSIAKQSGGAMLQPAQINQLAELIRKNENIKTVIHEDKRYIDMIDIKWVFILLFLLLSTEWFIRKREGGV